MTCILFDVATSTQLALALETARRVKLAEYGVVFSYSGDEASAACEQTRRAAAELGCPLYVFTAVERELPADEAKLSRERTRLRDCRNSVLRLCGSLHAMADSPLLATWTKLFSSQERTAAFILAQARPCAVIVGEDGVSGNSALIAAARRVCVPVVVCPYGYGGREDFENYIQEKHREGSLLILGESFDERVLSKKCGQWIRHTPHGRVVIFPHHFILARELAGWSMPDPWTPLGGSADYIAVESEAAFEHYRNEGLPEEKLKLMGSPYCDVLADVLAARPECAIAYERRAKIVPGRTRILISLPPSYHATRPDTNEFATYEAMCRNIVNACRRDARVDCTLSVHPATPIEQLRMLERLDLRIADEWVLNLIPQHDVYFTAFSSTIRWAVACGKPVLNYDAYRFNLAIYDGVTAVTTRQSLAELETSLMNILDDEEYGRVATRAAEERERWGVLDGQNTRRILEFCVRAGVRSTRNNPFKRMLNAVARW